MRVVVLASGTGSNLGSLLAHIGAGHVKAQVVGVVADRAAAGALDVARRHGVPAASVPPTGEPRTAHDARILDAVHQYHPDLLVLAGYMRILGPQVLAAFPDRIVNIHPSLLPAFRGRDAVGQAKEAGVAFAGCTTHLVTEDLDGGPILLQAALAVRPSDSLDDLRRRVLRLEHLILPRTVDLLAQGRFRLEGRRTTVQEGDTWLDRPGIDLASGAMYGAGF